jgi:valyl-tRNA synthetase
MTAVESQAVPTSENPVPAAGCDAAESAEKLAQKEAKAAAKKAEKEAKKLKALEKQKKQDADKEAAAANAGKKAEAKAAAKAKANAKAAEVQAKIDQAVATPKGQKKDVSSDPPDSYHPKCASSLILDCSEMFDVLGNYLDLSVLCDWCTSSDCNLNRVKPKDYICRYVEAAWYEWWSQCGYFKPDMNSDAEPFVLIIPPPNVTGALHIGHALTSAVQDTVIRYQRMKGRNTLWVPGTDHAGIATQTVVEKKVARELGKTRHDLGRETFVKHIWEYVKEYGNTIGQQERAMGISADWSREAFTLDENLTRAVLEAFVRLYQVRLRALLVLFSL